MKKTLPLLFALFFLHSCIPLRIAPKVDDYKIAQGKRFKKGLPKKQLFIFEDPKEQYQFYDYIDTKFELNDQYVDVQVPFEVEGRPYFFSFYEVYFSDKVINLVPLLFDATVNAALGNEDFQTYTSTGQNTALKSDNFYIAIEVFSEDEPDCLRDTYPNKMSVLMYLRNLKEEYLTTHNYNEVVFKN
ncbi:MAG: hypothetical protein AAF634_02255 [Bacteroidota bacterium]